MSSFKLKFEKPRKKKYPTELNLDPNLRGLKLLFFSIKVSLNMKKILYSTLFVIFISLVIAGDLIDQLPGIEQCALGYIVTEDRFGRSAVKITWDNNYKIRSPYDNKIYRVPDQIDPSGLKTAHAFAKYESHVFNKTEDWENFNGGQNGIKITIPGFFEFSRSKVHKRVK